MPSMQSKQCCFCVTGVLASFSGLMIFVTGISFVMNYKFTDLPLPPQWSTVTSKKNIGIIMICLGLLLMGLSSVISLCFLLPRSLACDRPTTVPVNTDEKTESAKFVNISSSRQPGNIPAICENDAPITCRAPVMSTVKITSSISVLGKISSPMLLHPPPNFSASYPSFSLTPRTSDFAQGHRVRARKHKVLSNSHKNRLTTTTEEDHEVDTDKIAALSYPVKRDETTKLNFESITLHSIYNPDESDNMEVSNNNSHSGSCEILKIDSTRDADCSIPKPVIPLSSVLQTYDDTCGNSSSQTTHVISVSEAESEHDVSTSEAAFVSDTQSLCIDTKSEIVSYCNPSFS